MDYIWSWARDVYRPFIRKLFFNTTENLRDLSPASTDRFRQSLSLSTAPSPNLYNHDPDSMQLDETAVIGAQKDLDINQEAPEDDLLVVRKKKSCQSLVITARAPEVSASYNGFGSICYPNIVQFNFRLLIITDLDFLHDGTTSYQNSILTLLFSVAIELPTEQLQQLATIWTNKNPQLPLFDSSVTVTLFFQTQLDKLNWQIKRILNCICWRKSPIRESNDGFLATDVRGSNSQNYRKSEVEMAVLEVQEIHGRDSAWYALGNVSLVLLPKVENGGYKWVQATDLPDDMSEFLTSLEEDMNMPGSKVEDSILVRSLLQMNTSLQTRPESTLPDLKEGMPKGNSVLVIRPPSWPTICSKFCLFVLIDETVFDKPLLSRLLQEAMKGRWYTTGEYILDPGDKQTLYRWSRALT